MRDKRQSTAVIAAVASVVVGSLFLRFLRGRTETPRSDEIDRPGIGTEQLGGAERVSTDPLSMRVLLGRIEDNFATGYQTITAIIQGVALVVLVTTSALADASPWLFVAAPWVVTAAAVVRVMQVRWGGASAADA